MPPTASLATYMKATSAAPMTGLRLIVSLLSTLVTSLQGKIDVSQPRENVKGHGNPTSGCSRRASTVSSLYGSYVFANL